MADEGRRYGEALGCLADARLYFDENMENLAVLTKLYHAMMAVLFAYAGDSATGLNVSHKELIERFEGNIIPFSPCVAPGILDALHTAYKYTHQCGCAVVQQPDRQELKGLFPLVGAFIEHINPQRNTNRAS